MANEFEKHIAMEPEDSAPSDEATLYSQSERRPGGSAQNASDPVLEHPLTLSATAILIGAAGFALGWVCGQSSARSERYWY
jgi:hypothetical protein